MYANTDAPAVSDAEFLERFLAGTLAPASFRHADHVRAAWLTLCTYPGFAALERFCSGIHGLAAAVGKPGLYHETITWAYLFVIRERIARAPEAQTWPAFAAANPDLFAWKPGLLERLYRDATLESDLARRCFVMPDRVAAPGGGGKAMTSMRSVPKPVRRTSVGDGIPVLRVQTGIRVERRLLKVLKGLAEYHDITLGDLLEGICLHAIEGKAPFGRETDWCRRQAEASLRARSRRRREPSHDGNAVVARGSTPRKMMRGYVAAANRTVTPSPSPAALAMPAPSAIVASWRSATRLTMASPRPLPGTPAVAGVVTR